MDLYNKYIDPHILSKYMYISVDLYTHTYTP